MAQIKRCFLLVLFLCFAQKIVCQSVLTNSMVYNFNVGDTFQIHSSGNSCCYNDYLYVINAKNYSSNLDTVIYGLNVNFRSFQGSLVIYGSPTVTIGSYTSTWKYNNLNMPFPAPILNSGGYYQKDTLIFDYCNKQTLKSQSYCFSNFECDSKIEKYSCGLGHTFSYQFYYQSSLMQNYQPVTQNLTYYHKIGESPCGISNIGLILNIDKNYLDKGAINFYPNPTTDKITIASENIITSIEIMDLYGKILYLKSDNNTVIVKQLEAGIYFLKKINNNNVSSKKIIKID